MRRPTIFLNELSLTADRELEPQELLPHVLATLKTARETRRLRRELIVVGGRQFGFRRWLSYVAIASSRCRLSRRMAVAKGTGTI